MDQRSSVDPDSSRPYAAVAALRHRHPGELDGVELAEVVPEVDDVVVEDHVGVEEDPSVLRGEHVGKEEPGSGADLEHVDHALQVSGILDLHTGQAQLGTIVHLKE